MHQWSSSSFFDSSQIDSHYSYIIYITLHIYSIRSLWYVWFGGPYRSASATVRKRLSCCSWICMSMRQYFCLKELISFFKTSKILFLGSFPIEYLNARSNKKIETRLKWDFFSQGGQLNQHLSYWSFCLLNSTLVVYCFIVLYLFEDAVMPNLLPPESETSTYESWIMWHFYCGWVCYLLLDFI